MIFSRVRRRRIIRRIKCMDKCRKCSLLDELAKPFGYAYHCRCGFFTSTTDAWQKEAGYTWLYDYMAPRFQMVFDALPIYFNYRGKTWLIELWKGQYGINTGAEIGIYHADRLLSKAEYQSALFTAAEDDEMLTCTLRLCSGEEECLQITRQHWWHTAFLPGCFSDPKDLCLVCAVCFPNMEMCDAFYDGLCQVGYSPSTISIHGLCLSFAFRVPQPADFDLPTRFHRRLSQCLNYIFCKLYLRITKPFFHTEDRILYLYYCLPAAFRRLLRLRRFHRRCHRKNGCHPPQRCCRKLHKCQPTQHDRRHNLCAENHCREDDL